MDFINKDTIIHRMDPRVKVIILVSLTILIFLFNDPFYEAVICSISIVLLALARPPWRILKKYIKTIIPIAILFLILQTVFYMGPPAITIPEWVPFVGGSKCIVPQNVPIFGGWIFASWYGLVFGIALVFRLIGIILLIPFLTLTTKTRDLIVALNKMKIPYPLIFILVTGLRFVPTVGNQRKIHAPCISFIYPKN